MFQNWEFLLGEIWGLILIAALLGLFCGWLIWSRASEIRALEKRAEDLEKDVSSARKEAKDSQANLEKAQTQIDDLKTASEDAAATLASQEERLATLDDALKSAEQSNQDLKGAIQKERSEKEEGAARLEKTQRSEANLKGEVNDLRSRLNTSRANEARLTDIQSRHDHAMIARSRAQSEHANEIARVRQRDEEITALRKKLMQADIAAKRHANMEDELQNARQAKERVAELEKEVVGLRNQSAEASSIRSKFDTAQANIAERDRRIKELQDQLSAKESELETLQHKPQTAAVRQGKKPQTLASARGGVPDDLKRIKGVGPKLEALLHELGFFHFDQIAAWTREEVAWVDANLDGFNGRVTRDNWIEQAASLA